MGFGERVPPSPTPEWPETLIFLPLNGAFWNVIRQFTRPVAIRLKPAKGSDSAKEVVMF